MSKTRNFANCYLYGKKDSTGYNVESELVDFIIKAQRIDRNSNAFKPIKTDVRSRQNTAVLYRVLLNNQVVLCIGAKELPRSFKAFRANDLKDSGKKPKVFIDVTGVIDLQDGFFQTKDIDRLCAYLLDALVEIVYYTNPNKLCNNSNVQKLAGGCFIQLFAGLLDYLRLTGYTDNKVKICFIIGTYFQYRLVGLDLKSAEAVTASLLDLSKAEATEYGYYCDANDMENIATFVESLAKTFKLEGLTPDTFIDRWMYLYGPGTLYGTELLPSFLQMITDAYSGSYINNMKRIETICGKDLVSLSTLIIRIGSDIVDKGFKYESAGQMDEIRDEAYMAPIKAYINEAKAEYSKDDYGIPSLKKYPMPDEKHVKSAIKLFGFVDAAHEKELAMNILKKIKKFKMTVNVGRGNKFYKYYTPVEEAGLFDDHDMVDDLENSEKYTEVMKKCHKFFRRKDTDMGSDDLSIVSGLTKESGLLPDQDIKDDLANTDLRSEMLKKDYNIFRRKDTQMGSDATSMTVNYTHRES